jgi:putative drug exporter of the RND superfamily
MFNRLGEFISRHWLLTIALWAVFAVVLHGVAPRWNDVTHDGDLAYLPDRMPSVQGERLLAEAFPKQLAKSQIAVVLERRTGALEPPDFQLADQLNDRFENLRDELPIVGIWNRDMEVVGDKLTSRVGPDGQATAIVLQLSNEFMAVDNVRVLDRVLEVLADALRSADFPQGLALGLTGSAALGGDMLSSAAQSIRNTEWATIGLVILILLLVYRAPVLAVIPLVTIGLSFLISTDFLALLTQLKNVEGFGWWNFKVFTTSKIFIVVILFGAGTDFCLFLISRFREDLERGDSTQAALASAVGSVGHALVGSGMTTICGLGMMYFADFGKFRNSGPAIAMSLVITLLACVTLAPALVAAAGDKVFWPWGVRKRTKTIPQDRPGTANLVLPGPQFAPAPLAANSARIDPASTGTVSVPAATDADFEPTGGFWDWASRVIIARPGLILTASLLLLSPLAYAGLGVGVTYDLLNELQADRPSVQGTEMILRHFAAGELTPVTILAVKENGRFDEPEGNKEIARLSKVLYELPGVASVRSLTEPLGNPPGYLQPFSSEGRKKLMALKHPLTKATYLTQVPGLVGKVARFDVVLKTQPFSLEAIQTLQGIDQKLRALSAESNSHWYESRFDYVGATVGVRDLQQVTESDQKLIEKLTVLAVLAVLIVILRRPVVCVYLILSVLFSYYVTIGCTELLFHWLYGNTFFGLDWKVPIFLFVILIAVGEDYNIYLMTRVSEEQRRHGPIAGLQLAVARTGGIITSCGVIMAGTFISMITGSLRAMHELGFALAAGVMLDTCVVRPILVPAFMAILDRRQDQTPSVDSAPAAEPAGRVAAQR